MYLVGWGETPDPRFGMWYAENEPTRTDGLSRATEEDGNIEGEALRAEL